MFVFLGRFQSCFDLAGALGCCRSAMQGEPLPPYLDVFGA